MQRLTHGQIGLISGLYFALFYCVLSVPVAWFADRSNRVRIIAAALATRYWAGASAPEAWLVEVPGGVVGVSVSHHADGEHVSLSGPAELVFTGALEL